MRQPRISVSRFILPILFLAGLQGCILVRVTEHRIHLNDDGSGDAVLRMIDLRSDAPEDSLIARDVRQMMQAYDKYGVEEFEQQGRKIVNKEFQVHGDTLILEISYLFPNPGAIEGLRRTKDDMYMVVGESREVVTTNGRIEKAKDGSQSIHWDSNGKQLLYIIKEKSLPPSRSLAGWYLKLHR